MDDNSLAPPAWVHKRDGRQEPFDADKISRALFAASESLQRPDAFLARELTDGVVHFLTEETDDAAPTTIQIAELVVKVVRELGQPALAAAFAEYGRRAASTPQAVAGPAGGRRGGGAALCGRRAAGRSAVGLRPRLHAANRVRPRPRRRPRATAC